MTGSSLNFSDQGSISTPVEFVYKEQDLQQNPWPITFVGGVFLMMHKPRCKNLFYLSEI